MLHAARCKCRTQKSRQKSPSGHHPTSLSGSIFATKACIDNRKKLVKQQYVLHMHPQYGELRPTIAAEISLPVWGTPANFNGFRVLAALLHGSQVQREPNCAELNRGRHLCSAGHWPTFLALHLRYSVKLLPFYPSKSYGGPLVPSTIF